MRREPQAPRVLLHQVTLGGDLLIAKRQSCFILERSLSVTTAMIVALPCLRVTYLSRRLWPGSRVIPRYPPALARFERSLRAVTGKDTETPAGCGAHSARVAGAKLALLPFQPRGKHPRREQRAPRFTPSSQINCPHELISFRFGSPSSQSRRTLPPVLIPSVALWRKLQS